MSDDKEQERIKKELKSARQAFTNTERVNAETLWKDLATYILPNQNGGFMGNDNKAPQPDPRVFKSEPVIFNRDLSNAVHSTITNPAMEWSKLSFKNDALNEDEDGIIWRQQATKEIHHMLSDSNFDGVLGACYQSLFALGTFVCFHEELNKDGAFLGSNFQAWHLSEIAFSENSLGDVDCIYRKFKMTSKQLIEKFGEPACGETVCEKHKANPDHEYTVYLSIKPRDSYEDNGIGLAPAEKRPYQCLYILEQGARLLLEDGYYEFPCYVNRVSKRPGEMYGTGPGHDCLADIRGLNVIQRDDLVALAKAANPPFKVQQGNLVSADFRPAHMTVVQDINQFGEMVTQARFDVTDNRMEKIINNIKSGFYIDKLMLPPRTETGEMTAYEISQRLEQMQTVLGPVLSRLNYEFLTPLVIRSLKILMRSGKLAPLPDSILSKLPKKGGTSDVDLQISFVNSLARSQQLAELRNVQTWIQETTMMAQIKPEVLDNLDPDAILAYSAKIRDIPGNFTLPVEQVKQIRDQRAKMQQMQMALAGGEQASNIVKNVGGQNAGKTTE